MNQSLELTNIKIEAAQSINQVEIPTELELYSVKQKSDCLVQPEIYIKTEPQENENELPVIAGTSYDMCHYDDIKVETEESLIKIECKDLFDESMQDPLDVGGEMKVGISTSDSDFGAMRSNNPVQCENRANSPDQFLVINKLIPKDKKHICHVCNKTFTYTHVLNNHLRIHTGEKPFACNVCEKSFTEKGALRKHMCIHSGAKPHVCNVCKKVFGQKIHLNNHKVIHSGVKSYSCHVCNKSFTHKPNLVVHKRMHTGEKPYTCDFCDKAFTQKSTLMEHKHLHTGEKPYLCDICNKSFAQKPGLNQHKKIHKK